MTQDAFPEDELPTRPDGIEHRAQAVLRRWAKLPEDDRRFVEHMIGVIERRNANPPKPFTAADVMPGDW